MIVQPIARSIVSPIVQSIGTGSSGGGVVPSGDTIFAATLPADGSFVSANGVTLAMGGVVTWTWNGFGSPSTDINTTILPEATPISFVGVVTPSGALLTANLSGAVGEATGDFVQIPSGCVEWALTGADGIDFSGVTMALPVSLTVLSLQRGADSPNGLANAPSFAGTALNQVYLNNMGCVGWDGGVIPVTLTYIEMEGNAFSEAAVDALLVACVTANFNDGEIRLNQGTSAAPGVAGIAAKATLEGRGWTVAVNP